MSKSLLKRKIMTAVFCAGLGMTISGCVYLIVGGVAAAGGYAVSRDTIQGETARSFDEVWEAAVEIVSIMGKVDAQSYELGQLDGVVNAAKIKINVLQLTPATVRLKVKARKNIFPSIANAQNIYVKIMNRLDQ